MTYRQWVEMLVDAVHCPVCGRPASHMAVEEYDHDTFWVQPIYQCSTPGCPLQVGHGRTWTIDLKT